MNFNSKGMTCQEFVSLMKERGYTYNENGGGFLRKNGKRAGKTMRNGYRTISLQKDHVGRTFCEHRCVWVWFNGEIPDGMVINHLDFDRSNNRIENLEMVTPTENIRYTASAGRLNPCRGEKSPRAKFTEKEVQMMRYLHDNGWSTEQITQLMGEKWNGTVGRVVNGARYGDVPSASTVMSIYPAIVLHTINKDLTEEQQITNAITGMCGELGEVADIIKKHLYQGHDLDEDHLIEEIGDCLYYVTLLMCIIDFNMADTMFNNMDKLMRRYPAGFDPERSINRTE